jgi:Putative restriction endonuclease
MHRLSFCPSARIAGPDLCMHLRRVAAQRIADFYFFYVDAGLVVFLNAIQTRLVVSELGLCASFNLMAARMRPLNTLCLKEMPPTWHVRAEQPARLGDRSMPEPNATVVRAKRRDYTDRHPSQRDVGLVVEVSDTNLAKDRRRTRVYGAGDIPVYWIINLVDREVEVYASPTLDGYGVTQI